MVRIQFPENSNSHICFLNYFKIWFMGNCGDIFWDFDHEEVIIFWFLSKWDLFKKIYKFRQVVSIDTTSYAQIVPI